MKSTFPNLTLFLLILSLTLQVHAQTNSSPLLFEWAKNNTGTADGAGAETVATTSDEQGYVYLTGSFSDVLYFGGDSLLSAKGKRDAFVLKLAPDGKVIWATQFGYASSDAFAVGWALAVDNSGNVYTTGRFEETIDFNLKSTAASGTLTSAGNWDAYFCKLNDKGEFAWVKRMSGTSLDVADQVALDRFGHVYVSGYFTSMMIDLNPGTGVDTFSKINSINNNNSHNRFVCKFDTSGQYLWGLNYDKGSSFANTGGMALDTSGNVYLAGSFQKVMVFPNNSGLPPLNGVAPSNMYLLKIDSSGTFLWAKEFGGITSMSNNYLYGLTADKEDHLYLTGNFNSTTDLDPGPDSVLFDPTGSSWFFYDVFVLKVDTSGGYIWATTFGSSQHDNGMAVAVDKVGNVYVTGSFQDSVSFVPGSTKPEDNITSNGSYDIYTVKFDSTGNYRWSAAMGGDFTPTTGNGPDRGDDLTIDPSGNLYVTGIFANIVDFNTRGTNKVTLDSDDGAVFMVKYSCHDTSSSSVTVDDCDHIVYNGITYDSSGHYIQTLPNAVGCDSTIHLDLTVYHIAKPVININGFTLGTALSYSTYQWLLNGNLISGATDSAYEVKQNGDYQVIVTNEHGCIDTSDIYTVNNAGIEDINTLARAIKVYPNPATEKVFIQSPVSVGTVLTDITGRWVKQVTDARQISLKDLSNGVYLLRISNQEGTLIKVEKIVKQTP